MGDEMIKAMLRQARGSMFTFHSSSVVVVMIKESAHADRNAYDHRLV